MLQKEAYPENVISAPRDKKEPITEEFKQMLWSKCFRLENLKIGKSNFGYFASFKSAVINFTIQKCASYTRRIVPTSSAKQYAESNARVLGDIKANLKNNVFQLIKGADLGSKNAMGIVEMDTKYHSETSFLLTNKMWHQWTHQEKYDRKMKLCCENISHISNPNRQCCDEAMEKFHQTIV